MTTPYRSGIFFLVISFLYLIITETLLLIPIRFFYGSATGIVYPLTSAEFAERF
jgi:hypothetical protein